MTEDAAVSAWLSALRSDVREGFDSMLSTLAEFQHLGRQAAPQSSVPGGQKIYFVVCFALGLVTLRNLFGREQGGRMASSVEAKLSELMGSDARLASELSAYIQRIYDEAGVDHLDPVTAVTEKTLAMLGLDTIDESAPLSAQSSNRLLVSATENYIVQHVAFWRHIRDQYAVVRA